MEDRSARIALKGRPLTGRVRMVADGNQVPARGTTRDALSMLSIRRWCLAVQLKLIKSTVA